MHWNVLSDEIRDSLRIPLCSIMQISNHWTPHVKEVSCLMFPDHNNCFSTWKQHLLALLQTIYPIVDVIPQ